MIHRKSTLPTLVSLLQSANKHNNIIFQYHHPLTKIMDLTCAHIHNNLLAGLKMRVLFFKKVSTYPKTISSPYLNDELLNWSLSFPLWIFRGTCELLFCWCLSDFALLIGSLSASPWSPLGGFLETTIAGGLSSLWLPLSLKTANFCSLLQVELRFSVPASDIKTNCYSSVLLLNHAWGCLSSKISSKMSLMLLNLTEMDYVNNILTTLLLNLIQTHFG